MRSVFPCPCLAVCLLLTAAALPITANGQTLTLENGTIVTPYPADYPADYHRYYGCQDTQLDPDAPDANRGRSIEQGLVGGVNRKVLIQFRNLNRAIGPNREISSVRLVLHAVPGHWTTTNTVSVYRLLKPWRQGSMPADNMTPQQWTSSYNYRLYSVRAGDALAWATPGAGAPGVDRAATASITRSAGTGFTAATNIWTLSLPAADVADMLDDPGANFGWVIEYQDYSAATGDNLFYSSEAQNIDLRPELYVRYADLETTPARDVDLSVLYITRTPEYERYGNSTYEYKTFHNDYTGILKNPTYAYTQKHPNNGDVVTFTAHVKNQGLTTNSGPFNYRWVMNGEVIATGSEPTGVAPGAEATYALDWTWDCNDYAEDTDPHRKTLDARDRELRFDVDYDRQVAELTRANNSLTNFIEAPCLGIFVEETIYALYNNTLNQLGSYSFEDYVNWHMQIWNETYFEMSRFAGFAEDGALERVRVQRVTVVPDGELCGGGNHNLDCRGNPYYDGEWGWIYVDGSDEFVEKHTKVLEGSLLHECTHQLGMIDLYTMNNEAGTISTPVRVWVHGSNGDWITRGYYPPYGGLMGGGDTRYDENYEATGMFSGWTVGAFNSNVGYRRGYYGEELYDVPDVVKLRPLDGSGAPIPGAQVRIWQGNNGGTTDGPSPGLYWDWQPIIDTTTDSEGLLEMPNIGTLEDAPYTTITGHTLKPNPWGRINVVGVNGGMLVRVTAYGQEDYRFIRLPMFNVAYWKGCTDEYVHDMVFDIAPDANIGAANLALGATATTSGAGAPQYAIDGNLSTRWSTYGQSQVGDYVQIDLGAVHNVAKIVVKQNDYYASFYEDFRIETSLTGAFAGEESFLDDEETYWSNAISDRRDMDPANETFRWVTYAGFPAAARYVRITCEKSGYVNVAEIEVYEATCETDAPEAVSNLAVIDQDASSATLSWTAPGDDGADGLAELYDLRWSLSTIDDANFDSAPAIDAPAPLAGGMTETLVVDSLPDAKRYFALKTRDTCGNWSALSNVATLTEGNAPPTVDAGDDREVKLPSAIAVLSGTATDDGLPNPPGALSYEWTQIDGPVVADIASPTSRSTSVQFSVAGVYVFQLRVTDSEFFRYDTTTVTVKETGRVSDGLVVLYDFEEGEGSTVYDVSGYSTALDLMIVDTANVTWTNGGLRLDGPARILTPLYASKIIAACMNSDAITLEAWVIPTAAQAPSRILTISPHDNSRNVSLEQGTPDGLTDNVYTVRLRTTDTNDNGEPGLSSPAGSATTGLQHVIYTRDTEGAAVLYVDGEPVASGYATGDLSDWSTNYRMILGDEYGQTASWLGEYRLIAIYSRALSADDVTRNYEAGAEPSTGLVGDVNCDGALNAFDIDPFVLALVNEADYAAAYPNCDHSLADINGDGAVNAFDIDPFVTLLVSGY